MQASKGKSPSRTPTKTEQAPVTDKKPNNSTTAAKIDPKKEVAQPPTSYPQQPAYTKKKTVIRQPVSSSKFTASSKYVPLDDVATNYDTMETLPAFPDLDIEASKDADFFKPVEISKQLDKPEVIQTAEKKAATVTKALEKSNASTVRISEANSTLVKPKINVQIETVVQSGKQWVSFVGVGRGHQAKSLLVEEKPGQNITSFILTGFLGVVNSSMERFYEYTYSRLIGRSFQVIIGKHKRAEIVFGSALTEWRKKYKENRCRHIVPFIVQIDGSVAQSSKFSLKVLSKPRPPSREPPVEFVEDEYDANEKPPKVISDDDLVALFEQQLERADRFDKIWQEQADEMRG